MQQGLEDVLPKETALAAGIDGPGVRGRHTVEDADEANESGTRENGDIVALEVNVDGQTEKGGVQIPVQVASMPDGAIGVAGNQRSAESWAIVGVERAGWRDLLRGGVNVLAHIVAVAPLLVGVDGHATRVVLVCGTSVVPIGAVETQRLNLVDEVNRHHFAEVKAEHLGNALHFFAIVGEVRLDVATNGLNDGQRPCRDVRSKVLLQSRDLRQEVFRDVSPPVLGSGVQVQRVPRQLVRLHVAGGLLVQLVVKPAASSGSYRESSENGEDASPHRVRELQVESCSIKQHCQMTKVTILWRFFPSRPQK